MKSLFFLTLFLVLPLTNALADSTRCSLTGPLVPNINENAKTKLEDNLRLQFDSTEKADCEAKIVSYCKYHVLEDQYMPTKLKAYFKDKKGIKTDYKLSDKCKIIRENDDQDPPY